MKFPSRHFLRAGLLVTLLLGAASLPAHADLIGYWSLNGDANAWGASAVQSGANVENDMSCPVDQARASGAVDFISKDRIAELPEILLGLESPAVIQKETI